jgi:hypothetical protein
MTVAKSSVSTRWSYHQYTQQYIKKEVDFVERGIASLVLLMTERLYGIAAGELHINTSITQVD